jgi:hypothetical protein
MMRTRMMRQRSTSSNALVQVPLSIVPTNEARKPGWGISVTYLEGAFLRALDPPPRIPGLLSGLVSQTQLDRHADARLERSNLALGLIQAVFKANGHRIPESPRVSRRARYVSAAADT